MATPAERLRIERVHVRLAGHCRLADCDRPRQDRVGRMRVGRPASDMIVPAIAARLIEQDALETMIGGDRPSPLPRDSRQVHARQPQPSRFQRGAILRRER